MVEEIFIMTSSSDVSREGQSAGADDCVNIKIEDEELKEECAADEYTTAIITPLTESDTSQGGDASSSSVEIPSAAVKAEVSSSADDSSSMPPPPAVVRAAASLNATSATSASSTAGRVPHAAGAPPARTTPAIKQEIKQVHASPHPSPTSSSTRPGMVPPNPVARTTGLIGRPVVQQPNSTASVAPMKAGKLHVKVHGTVYPNPAISSSAVVKPSPALSTSPADVVQSSASQYEADVTPSSDISITSNSSGGGGSSSKNKTKHPLRRGKWTTEEEAYANRLIGEFKNGLLPLTDGTTLRNFLSKLLNCDPMRISKKFVGNNCIGKQVFRWRVAEINRITTDQMQQTKMELCELERRFLDRVAQTNRVKAPGVSAAIGPNGVLGPLPPNLMTRGVDDLELDAPPTPPWLRPPSKYKPTGKFADRLEAKAKATAERKAKLAAAAAAAAAVTQASDEVKKPEAIRAAAPPLKQLARAASNEAISRTESALEQLARTASGEFKFVFGDFAYPIDGFSECILMFHFLLIMSSL